MSATQPIPQVVEVFGDWSPDIVAAFRPEKNGFGRRTGWIKADHAHLPISRTALRHLREQGFTRVKLSTNDADHTFVIEELLA